METTEIEVRFLDIDKDALIKKLLSLGAKDFGEVMLEEVILYDKDLKWLNENKLVRLRKSGDRIELTYKQNLHQTADSAREIEFEISDFEKAGALLEKLGLVQYRHQQKMRHTFEYGGITLDIDTWPRIPTYVELEGESEGVLKKVATELGFDWKNVVTKDARYVIEDIYKIPIAKMHWFTFDRFE